MTDEAGFEHQAVMKGEVVAALAPDDGGLYLDATLGRGGHSLGLLEAGAGRASSGSTATRPPLRVTQRRLAVFGDRVTIVHESFANVRDALATLGVEHVDGACADLGVSSPQLDDAARGMSFRREGPIDMRMDLSQGETALDLIDRLVGRWACGRPLPLRGGAPLAADRAQHQAGAGGRGARRRRSTSGARSSGPWGPSGSAASTRRRARSRRSGSPSTVSSTSSTRSSPPWTSWSCWAESSRSSASTRSKIASSSERSTTRPSWEPLWKKPRVASDEETAENPRSRSAKLRAARRAHGK